MEERTGTLVSYDAATGAAVIKDDYTASNVNASDIGGIGQAPNPPIPVGAAIIYIAQYIPPRGAAGAAKIVNIIREVKG